MLEVCVDSLSSAKIAAAAGADRLELCAGLVIGGLTPPLSLLRAVKAETGLPVHVLLRPRFGDFLYTPEELALLKEDGEALLAAGADGLVFGALTPAGDLDPAVLAPFVRLAHGAGRRFTLHRAFDLCRDPFSALEKARTLGADSVLSSGQAASAMEGLPLLCGLLPRMDGMELLIGGGVDAPAIRAIRAALPEAGSFHLSGKRRLESGMAFRRAGVPMGLPGLDEYSLYQADGERIAAAKRELAP